MSLLLNRTRHSKPILSPSPSPTNSSPSNSPVLNASSNNPGQQRWFTMLALPDQPTLARRDLNGFRTRLPPTKTAGRNFVGGGIAAGGSRTSDSGYRDSGGSHASILGRSTRF
jgi:hypothetical protein